MNKFLVVGITGQSGAGKTKVSEILSKKYSFNTIDADMVSRKVVEPGKPALKEISDYFGEAILDSAGGLHRVNMGNIVFGNLSHKLKLESIIFPYIMEEIGNQVKLLEAGGEKAVFLDAPTLFEAGGDKLCDRIISVIAPKELRIERLLERDSITPEQIQARLASQHDDAFYTDRSDYVIKNDGNMNEVEKQIFNMLVKFRLIDA